MLKTKCIRVEHEPSDGLRISIMSRHTEDDGQTPDSTITPDSYDQWWPILGPPLGLIGAYCRQEIDWDEYTAGFMDHLEEAPVVDVVERLAHMALRRNVTLLCTEETPEQCHRRLVAERCQAIVPELEIVLL